MSGSTGNIRGEVARQEQELKRGESEGAQRTTGDIARQGHGPLDMGPPEQPGETHKVAEEVKAAREKQEESLEDKRKLYERAEEQLKEDGESMLRRMSSVA